MVLTVFWGFISCSVFWGGCWPGPCRALSLGWVQEQVSALGGSLALGGPCQTPGGVSLPGGWLAGITRPSVSCCWRAFSFSNICVSPLPSLSADLSAAKRKFADSLNEFKFRCIGDAETDDEICIGESWALVLWAALKPRSQLLS